MVLNLIFIKNN